MFTDKFFMPSLYIDNIYEISPKKLSEKGIRAVLLDIDNTLVTYDDPMPTEALLDWFDKLKKNNISIAFISNNNKERVELFNSELKFFASWNSKKPSTKCYIKAMNYLGTDKTNTAVIGDQIFTDIWSAKKLGLYCILVNPIKDKTSLFFKTKRILEKPIINQYKKRNL